MKRTRLAMVAVALAPAGSAYAQVIGLPTSDAPTSLDPAATGTQAPPRQTATPTTQQPAAQGGGTGGRTGVVIVGPDGKVIGGDAQGPAPDTTYYVPSGSDVPSDYETGYQLYSGATPELYVVRSGDTLWGISWTFFNDPWQWPKVWSYNPQITNPHWIYPGDLVRLLPRGVFASSPATPQNPNARQVDPLPSPTVRTDVGIKTLAFVEKADLEQSIVIDGAVDEKQLLGAGDQVYLAYPKNKVPTVGARFSIYKPGQVVKLDGKELGSYVRLLGTLEVVSAKDDKRARGVIIEGNMEIERGAKVGPLVTRFENVPPVEPTVNAQAEIVAHLTHDQLIGQGAVVFVALGKSSGVQVGNRMYVVRRGDGYPAKMDTEVGLDDRRFPARALGEVVIVEVGANVSIGLVTLSVQEMGIGDQVMMQKASDAP